MPSPFYQPPSRPIPLKSFSISTLLLAMTICSVWLAVTMAEPCLGICALLLLAPASVRTVVGVNICKRAGIETSAGAKLRLLVISCLHFFMALIMFLFLWFILAMLIGLVALVAGDLIEDPHAGQQVETVLSFCGVGLSFFLSLIPPIYVLTQAWPQGYDPWQGRLLNRVEHQDRMKDWTLVPEQPAGPIPLCPECKLPHAWQGKPCLVCGRTEAEVHAAATQRNES